MTDDIAKGYGQTVWVKQKKSEAKRAKPAETELTDLSDEDDRNINR